MCDFAATKNNTDMFQQAEQTTNISLHSHLSQTLM